MADTEKEEEEEEEENEEDEDNDESSNDSSLRCVRTSSIKHVQLSIFPSSESSDNSFESEES